MAGLSLNEQRKRAGKRSLPRMRIDCPAPPGAKKNPVRPCFFDNKMINRDLNQLRYSRPSGPHWPIQLGFIPYQMQRPRRYDSKPRSFRSMNLGGPHRNFAAAVSNRRRKAEIIDAALLKRELLDFESSTATDNSIRPILRFEQNASICHGFSCLGQVFIRSSPSACQ